MTTVSGDKTPVPPYKPPEAEKPAEQGAPKRLKTAAKEEENKAAHAAVVTTKPDQELRALQERLQQVKTESGHAQESVEKLAHSCLSQLDRFPIKEIEDFSLAMFKSCAALRSRGKGYLHEGKLVEDKLAERYFCNDINKAILKQTEEIANDIAKDSSLSPDQKAQKMQNLKNLAAGLCQLVGVHRRFGGSIAWSAFHNLFHSLNVGEESGRFYKLSPAKQYAAFNAGAAHDSVMMYEGDPDLVTMNGAGIKAKKEFFEMFDKRLPLLNAQRKLLAKPKPLSDEDRKELSSIEEELQKTKDQWLALVKVCYQKGEQKRKAGTGPGFSEGESIEQFKAFNKEVDAICIKAFENTKEESTIEKFNSLSDKDTDFGTKLIKTTVPQKGSCFFPGGGHKCYAVSNVPLMPDPVSIADLPEEQAEIGKRLLDIQDKALKQAIAESGAKPEFPKDVKGGAPQSGTYSYLETLKDIREFRQNPTDPNGKFVLPAHMQVPFLIKFFSESMPPFNDPVAPFIQLIADGKADSLLKAYEKALVSALQEDLKENGDGVIKFLKEREQLMGTPTGDLQHYTRKDANPWWSIYVPHALMSEEQPAITEKFRRIDFNLPQSLRERYPDGLKDDKLRAFLDDQYEVYLNEREEDVEAAEANFLKNAKISIEDYQNIQLFIEASKYNPRDQVPFGKGKLAFDEFRNNIPLAALTTVLAAKDKEIPGHLAGYRESNCVEGGRLRRDGLMRAIQYDVECRENGPGFIISEFYKTMTTLAGSSYKEDPSQFTLTKDGRVIDAFKKESTNRKIVQTDKEILQEST